MAKPHIKKRIGRPPKHHAPGTSVLFSLQMPAELKGKLQEQASAENRTLSQEILRRLERSLDSEEDDKHRAALRRLDERLTVIEARLLSPGQWAKILQRPLNHGGRT